MPEVPELRGRPGRSGPRIALGFAALLLVVSACGSDPGSDSNTAAVEITGVETFDDLDRNHVSGKVDYSHTPTGTRKGTTTRAPVGGDHAAIWQNCGFYSTPVITEQGVHSMEHGAVWITYDPALPADQVAVLRGLAGDTHVLVSPFPGLPSPVVASAWGVQLQLPSAGDERLAQFVTTYREGPQTPEPGAPCTGAAGDPE
ncbi:MAG: DUF3105 domain-containing protein [Acidimicrobiia bacterium]|nr:DUF3105 domain-containing protein [Acidimicrobiia bacterium]